MKKTKEQSSRIIVPEGDGESIDGQDEARAASAEPNEGRLDTTVGDTDVNPPSADEMKTQIEALTEQLARAKADYQNLQRRTSNEMNDAVRYANAELMKSLLSVLDDFDRALAAGEDSEQSEELMEGIRLVHTNFMRSLQLQGLEVIDALHKPFDPSFHEALLQKPSDQHPPHTVIEEAARGYILRGRVLRPSKVIVSKSPEDNA